MAADLVKDGMSNAPSLGKVEPVVGPGEFVFAGAFLDHGHLFGQINGLLEAGGTLKWVWDPQPERLQQLLDTYKHAEVQAARSFEEILEDPAVHLVTAAAVPNERGPIGLRVMDAGKDYFTDKCPFTTLDQLAQARAKADATGRKYLVDYSERLHTEAGWYAGELLAKGVIGKVLQVLILAPHRLNKPNRPAWFFEKEKYGGIITDIGSHQFEQMLAYCGATDGTIVHARVDNFANPDVPELEDYGEATATMDTGASCYMRVDWFTPDGLPTWGDGRTFVLGTEGYLEVRKYYDLATNPPVSQRIYLVTQEREEVIDCKGKVGYPFYGRFIKDVLNRTEEAMTQAHAFKAAELSMLAQKVADDSRQG